MGQAESKFYLCLKDVVGENYLLSKSIGKKITKNDLHLDKDLERNPFPGRVIEQVKEMLLELGNDGTLPGGSVSHNIDGLVLDHPQLGTRIVEFDEIQHFTPFRLITLSHLKDIDPAIVSPGYVELCEDRYVFMLMLKKHRLPGNDIDNTVGSIDKFLDLIRNNFKTSNGYIAPKKGFDFPGGRIAQRAYYDALRDITHFSEHNKHLAPILRFSKVLIEREYQADFSSLSNKEISVYIKNQIKTIL